MPAKTTLRRRPPQPQPQQPQPEPAAAGIVVWGVGHYVIRGSGDKHGPARRLRWGQRQYAQATIALKFPQELVSPRVNVSALTLKVRRQLAKDPAYVARGFKKKVGRKTVERALAAVRSANR
jgi:hypothetical protein